MSTTSMMFNPRDMRNWFASIGKYLAKIIYAPGVTQLPLVLTSLLFVILLFNAMTTTMVFAFSPRLIKSFGISEIETATYVGYLASSMFVGQSFFSFLWGYVGDVKGKRFAVFWACICASAVSLAFGFSKSFWWAVSTRFLLGACGVHITVTNLVFEICDNTNKSIGMAVCITSYAVGLVLGPSIGGFMVFLREQYPGLISRGSFLDTYKVFLPNLVLSLGFLIMPIILLCLIQKRKSRDPNTTKDERMKLLNKNTTVETDEVDVPEDYVSKRGRSVILSLLSLINWTGAFMKFTLWKFLSNKQCVLGCFIMTLFHFFGIGFNEIYPVWADSSLEFHGLNFSASQIGTSLLIAAVVLIFAQPVILSRTTTYFGVKQVFMYGLIVQMVLYPLYPLVAEITDRWLLWVTLCTLIIITRIAVGACFLGTTVIVNDSVSEELSGSANGLGVGLSGIGRLLAPLAFGRLYSWSLANVKGVPVNNHPLGFPFDQYFSFFVMSILATLCAFLLLLVKEDNSHKNLLEQTDTPAGTSDVEETNEVDK